MSGDTQMSTGITRPQLHPTEWRLRDRAITEPADLVGGHWSTGDVRSVPDVGDCATALILVGSTEEVDIRFLMAVHSPLWGERIMRIGYFDG